MNEALHHHAPDSFIGYLSIADDPAAGDDERSLHWKVVVVIESVTVANLRLA